jgi:Ca-activated chloride channel family protein
VLANYADARRRRTWELLAQPETRAHLAAELNPRRRQWKVILLAATCGFTVLALCRPAWDRSAPASTKGRDIVVLLDVSRSMHAQDLTPSRLETARRALTGFSAQLRGDRIGLIAFAGTAALRCPLTTDYDFFRAAVAGVSPDSVPLGGTEIAKAISMARKAGFDHLSQRSKHLLLITDAEDHGYGAAAAAAEAARNGVRLVVVGLGDETPGARVPVHDAEDGPTTPVRYLTYRGQEVWSKLNARAIRNLADAGDGRSLIISKDGGNSDLGAQLNRLVSGTRGRPALPRTEGYWIPLLLAALCLTVELALPERTRVAK